MMWNNTLNNLSNVSSTPLYELCEISTSNILNYKRRSKLVSKTYCYESDKTTINEINTLKNCYNYLYDLKNTLSDYICMVRESDRKFSESETNKLIKILNESISEITSSCNIYKNYTKNQKYTLKQKRDINSMVKRINEVSNVIVLLSNDIKIYF